jgi:hypothetical protein
MGLRGGDEAQQTPPVTPKGNPPRDTYFWSRPNTLNDPPGPRLLSRERSR